MLRNRTSLSKIHLFTAVVLLYLSIPLSPIPICLSNSLVSANRSISPSYIEHDSISITNDNELAAVANSGTGTANDPYIIADWNITGSPTHGISITGTTKHFRIENCRVHNCSVGIFVRNASSGTTTIINNTCNSNSGSGIYVGTSGSSTLANNTCNSSNYGDGISLQDCSSSTLANNTCINNTGDGISLQDSGFSTVANNTCTNNNWAGIYLEDSGFSTVTNNTFFNDGLLFEVSSKEELFSCRVENNTVNGLPLGYFENKTDSTISETYGQLFLLNCNNTIVKNQYYSNSSIGIALYYCNENQLVNNTCNNNDGNGISLQDCSSSTLANNTCNSNGRGGVNLEDSGFSTVTNNTCNSNYGSGINLEDSGFSTVTNNTCTNNDEGGINLERSNKNSIVWNILAGNGAYGIELSDDSENNVIHHNDFITNGQNTSQACDDGWYNQWYDETVLEGNYWSDYSGTGNYSIDGLAGAIDPYPSLSPYRYTGETAFPDVYRYTSNSSSPAFPQDVLVRTGLFLVVIGFFVVALFVNRRKISS